jgi:hypothetical protein
MIVEQSNFEQFTPTPDTYIWEVQKEILAILENFG